MAPKLLLVTLTKRKGKPWSRLFTGKQQAPEIPKKPRLQQHSAGIFQQTDVASWDSLMALFATARTRYGTIDAVLANAGIPEREPFLFDDQLDNNGELSEPDFRIIDVNVSGVLRSDLSIPVISSPSANPISCETRHSSFQKESNAGRCFGDHRFSRIVSTPAISRDTVDLHALGTSLPHQSFDTVRQSMRWVQSQRLFVGWCSDYLLLAPRDFTCYCSNDSTREYSCQSCCAMDDG